MPPSVSSKNPQPTESEPSLTGFGCVIFTQIA